MMSGSIVYLPCSAIEGCGIGIPYEQQNLENEPEERLFGTHLRELKNTLKRIIE
jgi:hypothetical protein